jgi:hypothetical protein
VGVGSEVGTLGDTRSDRAVSIFESTWWYGEDAVRMCGAE